MRKTGRLVASLLLTSGLFLASCPPEAAWSLVWSFIAACFISSKMLLSVTVSVSASALAAAGCNPLLLSAMATGSALALHQLAPLLGATARRGCGRLADALTPLIAANFILVAHSSFAPSLLAKRPRCVALRAASSSSQPNNSVRRHPRSLSVRAKGFCNLFNERFDEFILRVTLV